MDSFTKLLIAGILLLSLGGCMASCSDTRDLNYSVKDFQYLKGGH